MLLPRTLILNFHGLGEPRRTIPDDERPYWISRDLFRAILARARGLAAAQSIDLHVTFDDGNESDHRLALPVLLDLGLKATFFVLAGRLDRPGSLARAQVRELAAAGMGIGNHGRDHVAWPALDAAALKDELAGARAAIAEVLGHELATASAPFGRYDRRVVAEVRRLGYTTLFTSNRGWATRPSGLCARNTIRAGFDPARDLDRLASPWQRWQSALREPLRRTLNAFPG